MKTEKPAHKKLFGTDGIRGIANIDPMTAEMALKIGRAAAYVFKQDERPHRFLIGKDTRLSGYMIETALVAGICSMGDDALLVGPLPTPGIAYITRSLRADAGIVISASHNPYEYNGIKFFFHNGYKLPDAVEKQIEELVFSGEIDSIRPTAHAVGKAYRIDDAPGRYVEFVKSSLPKGMYFTTLKVVLDCANGATYKVAPAVFRELGADITVIGDEPNGTNINKDCGSLYPEQLIMKVKELKADMGFAFDGDGDRVMAVTGNGDLLDGDHILAMCGIFLKENNLLKSNTIVTTVMANMGLDETLQNSGIELIKTKVGDRYVMESMGDAGAVFGGEQSGHIIFKDYNTTGDGLITALQMARIVVEKKQSLSDLSKVLSKFPQYIQNIKVSKKTPFENFPEILTQKKKVEKMLAGKGRLLLRYSGTEPMIRVMIECKHEINMNEVTRDLVAAIKKNLGGGVNYDEEQK